MHKLNVTIYTQTVELEKLNENIYKRIVGIQNQDRDFDKNSKLRFSVEFLNIISL